MVQSSGSSTLLWRLHSTLAVIAFSVSSRGLSDHERPSTVNVFPNRRSRFFEM